MQSGGPLAGQAPAELAARFSVVTGTQPGERPRLVEAIRCNSSEMSNSSA